MLPGAAGKDAGIGRILLAERAAILAGMESELEGVADAARRCEELLSAFLTTMETVPGSSPQPTSFIVTLDTILGDTLDAGGDVPAWQGAISALRERLLRQPALAQDPVLLETAESAWHQARVLIGERAWRAQAHAEWHVGQQSTRLHGISRALANARNVPELMDVVAGALPPLGISHAYLALYQDRLDPYAGCRLIMAYDQAGRKTLPPEGEFWLAGALACGALLPAGQPHSTVVAPLYYHDEALGFLLLEAGRATTSCTGCCRPKSAMR